MEMPLNVLGILRINGLGWNLVHPVAIDLLGYIPTFLSNADDRSAKEQLHDNYAHGGGWNKLDGFVLNPKSFTLHYPGDPAFRPVAYTELHKKEIVMVFTHAWVMILQEDGTYEIARMD